MSDDQDDFLSFTAAPIPAPVPKPPKQKSSQKKSSSTKRQQASQTSQVYGEELFQAAWKPEKSVVVCFHPFTKNYIRFSKDEYAGRFAIKYNMHSDGSFLLYHFYEPFEWEFDAEAEFEIKVDDSIRVFGPYDDIDKIKIKLMAIIRAETLLNKKKSLQEIREYEASVKVEAERIENEKEKLTEQLSDAGILADNKFIVEETSRENEKSSNETQICVEVAKEEKIDGSKIIKDRSGATVKLTPIEY